MARQPRDWDSSWKALNWGASKALGGQVIAYRRDFVMFGGVATALFLSQASYWGRLTLKDRPEGDGWFYKSQLEWEEETGLTRREQETARRNLVKAGVLEERFADTPRKLYFRVRFAELVELLGYSDDVPAGNDPGEPRTDNNGGNRHYGMAETATIAGRKPPSKDGGKRQANTETTTETTPENPSGEGDLFEAAPPKPKKAKKAKAAEPVVLKLPFVNYTQTRLDHLKNTCPGIDVEAELRSLTQWMDDQYRAGKEFDDPYGFVLRCLRKKSKAAATPKAPEKPSGLIRLGDEPAKPNGHPLPFTPFRVIDDMPPNTREGAAVMERLKVAGLFDDYNICWTPKAERHRGKWVNPA